jgi:hypothetical protein
MRSGDKLFRLLWILSLLAYAVLFVSLFLWRTERFLFGLQSIGYFYLAVGLSCFAWFGWLLSIATTLGVLVCYVLIIGRNDVAPTMRRWASLIALTSAVAFAVSYRIVPLIIPAP